MDPVTAAVQGFQEAFRAFRDAPDPRVLWVPTEAQSLGPLQQTLRGEEWDLGNRSPFLIFSQALDPQVACLQAMAEQVATHYGMLKEGVEKEGGTLPDFGEVARGSSTFGFFMRHLERWTVCTAGVVDPPYVCWLPADVQDPAVFRDVVRSMVQHAPEPAMRFLVTDRAEAPLLATVMSELGVPVVQRHFVIDQQAMMDWFKASMLATPAKGHATGTPPGSAAPDVAPPPRPGPPPPSDEEIRAVLDEAGVGPVLTAAQGSELERMVFGAAAAVGAGDAKEAFAQQHAAFELCGRAGVKLEQGMMALVLAGYLVHFQQVEDAGKWYGEAARLALEGDAPAQASQARMGLGYVYLQSGQFTEAAATYRAAAANAREAEVALLVLENLRMAGHSLERAGLTRDAVAAWMEAMQAAREMSPGELGVSGYSGLVEELERTLRAEGMSSESEWVRNVRAEIDEKVRVAVEAQGTESPLTAPSAGDRAAAETETAQAAAANAEVTP